MCAKSLSAGVPSPWPALFSQATRLSVSGHLAHTGVHHCSWAPGAGLWAVDGEEEQILPPLPTHTQMGCPARLCSAPDCVSPEVRCLQCCSEWPEACKWAVHLAPPPSWQHPFQACPEGFGICPYPLVWSVTSSAASAQKTWSPWNQDCTGWALLSVGPPDSQQFTVALLMVTREAP